MDKEQMLITLPYFTIKHETWVPIRPGVVTCACNPATRRLGLEDRLRTGALHWAAL